MTESVSVALVLAVLVIGSVAGVTAATSERVTVESVTYGGQSVVATPDEPLFIWRSDRHEFSVSVTAERRVDDAAVCLLANSSTGPRELGCQNVSLDPADDRTVTVEMGDWPANLTGARSVGAVVRNRTAERRVAESIMTLVAVERDGDLDGDGLANEAEVEAGTDLRRADTDGDGLADPVEVDGYGTDPLAADTDGDGLEDGAEVQSNDTDPRDPDTDGDGLPDGREVELGTAPSSADTDGDGLEDGTEINRYQTDPLAADTDGDGLGDGTEIREHGTDPQATDTDGDGLDDGAEVHLHGTDPTRADTDADGLSDRAEIEEYYTDPLAADTDGDGLGDGTEIREYETNPLTANTDRDGLGDGREVELGSDPSDPTSTAEPGLVQRALWTVSDRPLLAGLGVAGLVALAGVVTVVRRSGPTIRKPLAGSSTGEQTGEPEAATPPAAASEMEPDASSDEPGGDTTADHVAPDRGVVDDGGTPAGPEVDEDEYVKADEQGDDEAEGKPEEAEDSPVPAADTRIMTNQERVAHLLDEHDGRMLQSEMVEAADWSKATVSRVLSRMEEQGAITRVDIGRGNLVTRPEDEPPSVESPFEE